MASATLCQTGGQPASTAQTPQDQTNVPAAGHDQQTSESSAQVTKTPSRADAYYNFTMGHIFEQQYESTSKPEYATQAIDAANAGAAILHLHARDPKDGRPSPDPGVYMQFLPRIKHATDAVVNITTGGAVTMTVEQRISAAQQLSPEMCSLNMGSMNFALYPMAKRYKTWKYDWEESYLTNSDAYIFPNTFRDIEKVYKTLGEGHGVKFEHECYDTGHLYNLAHLIDKGLFKPPVFVQLIFGILGGIGADLDNLFFMKRTADRLFGKDYLWSVLAGGRHQMNFCTAAAMIGGNVRVGLEDSLYIGPGKLAKSNAEQVTKIRRIVEDLGFEIATPTEARAMLGLKGGDRVKF